MPALGGSARMTGVCHASRTATLALPHAGTRPVQPPIKPPAIAQTCVACHGAKGVSTIKDTPSLAGQPDIFTSISSSSCATASASPGHGGHRQDPDRREYPRPRCLLRRAAAAAAFPRPGRSTRKRSSDHGPRRCDNCHKEDFSGQGESARLAGQRPEYLMKALSDYRAGVRRGRGMGAMMEVSVTLQR